MKKRLQNFLKQAKQEEMEETLFLTNLSFFQHERLVHLIVTGFVSMCFLLTFFYCLNQTDLRLWLLCMVFGLMTICYIIHYFRLENGVQALYRIYDQMKGEDYELSSENGRTNQSKRK